MNLPEFLDKLKSFNGKAKFWASNISICTPLSKDACPITAVCELETGERFSVCQYEQAGRNLNLNDELVEQIVDAADKPYSRYSELRKQLLDAVGLKEPK